MFQNSSKYTEVARWEQLIEYLMKFHLSMLKSVLQEGWHKAEKFSKIFFYATKSVILFYYGIHH